MQACVLTLRQHNKVAGVVVELVVIDVVDDLVRGELPAFALLDDVAVLGDLDAVHADVSVATLDPATAADPSPIMASQVAARLPGS
jgi:hypothetical protein